MVEPLEEFEPHLKALSKKYDASYKLAAAGPEDGEISIRIFGGLSGSSVVPGLSMNSETTDPRFRRLMIFDDAPGNWEKAQEVLLGRVPEGEMRHRQEQLEALGYLQ